jgi:hypothetical protein
VTAPVLSIHGQYDWVMSREDHELIAAWVNRNRPGAGRFVEVPGMDHGYMRYPSAEAAFKGEGGVFAEDAPAAMVEFLREIANGKVSASRRSGKRPGGCIPARRDGASPRPGSRRENRTPASSGTLRGEPD